MKKITFTLLCVVTSLGASEKSVKSDNTCVENSTADFFSEGWLAQLERREFSDRWSSDEEGIWKQFEGEYAVCEEKMKHRSLIRRDYDLFYDMLKKTNEEEWVDLGLKIADEVNCLICRNNIMHGNK